MPILVPAKSFCGAAMSWLAKATAAGKSQMACSPNHALPKLKRCSSSSRTSWACTKPKWRSGKETSGSRARLASNGMRPSSASRISCAWRSVPQLLAISPQNSTSLRKLAKPKATAAAVCAMPFTSMTKATGMLKVAARSALEGSPSNTPMAPSTKIRSDC